MGSAKNTTEIREEEVVQLNEQFWGLMITDPVIPREANGHKRVLKVKHVISQKEHNATIAKCK